MDAVQQPEWAVLEEVYNHDEAQLICGLLSMARIPVKVDRDSASELYGLTIGPLAKIKIMVPGDLLMEAQKVLSGEVAGFEEPEE